VRFFSAIAFATVLSLFSPANAYELSTYEKVVLGYAIYQCAAVEGLMTIEEAVQQSLKVLRQEYGIESYQVANFVNGKGFHDSVKKYQDSKGGCQQIGREIMKK
jgi:hypothetical protein